MTEGPRLTRWQAAVIGAYTGTALGPFTDVHEYAQKKLGHPILTREFAREPIWAEIKEAARADLLALCSGDEPTEPLFERVLGPDYGEVDQHPDNHTHEDEHEPRQIQGNSEAQR